MNEPVATEPVIYDAGRIWVIKFGSSILTANGQGLAKSAVAGWVDEIVNVYRNHIQVVVVSSGAVAEGMSRLGIKSRSNRLHLMQAAAAVGQMGLVQLYESNFARHGLQTAQVLLTHDDLRSRERYINARSTLRNLLALGVVPVINENDTVVTDEIRFGDNDTLAALVANLIEADTLMLMTDQKGLFTEDPRHAANATLIRQAQAKDPALDRMAGGSGALGRGGMVTKLGAARIAARSGANTVLADGREPAVITRLLHGEVAGTLLRADEAVLASRKQWLADLPPRGKLVLDAGAVRVLTQEGRSLLPVGVRAVKGKFTRGEMVSLVDETGLEVARGLVNYSAPQATMIAGHATSEIESILGFVSDEELIHRDNLVIS